MTPLEARKIRDRCKGLAYPPLVGPHPLDGYSVREFTEKCRSGWFLRTTRPVDPGKSGRKIAEAWGDVTFEEITS